MVVCYFKFDDVVWRYVRREILERFMAKANSQGNDLREKAAIFQRFFEEAIFLEGIDKNESYLKISNTISFIEKAVSPFTESQDIYDNTVFVMGPSGVGKSTLMNYIAGKNLVFKYNEDRPGIFPQDGDAVAYVGKGEGSTTLAPNIWHANTEYFPGVTFIDCAGDFDSSGTITEVINSKIKRVVAQNAVKAKILIVTSQDSISPAGSYGMIFKEGLEKSAQFLSDIDYFENSMGLIISHAGRMVNTPNTVKSYLQGVIKNPQVEKYKVALESLVQNDCVTTFSKYSDEIEEGAIYAPPAWNTNQRAQIIDLINKISFKAIPKGLFSDSSSPEVREQMGKAFEILRDKAAKLLQNSIEEATKGQVVVRATELKRFAQFVEEEVICAKLKTGLMPYVRHLNKYQFLKISPNDEMKKLDGELEFVAPFTQVYGGGGHTQENWGVLVSSNLLFKDLLHEAKIIIHDAEGLFSAFVERSKIITTGCFGERSKQLKTCFSNLHTAYKNKANVESHKHDDKYYFYQNEKQFKGFKQEPYTEQQPYSVRESYVEKVPYEDIEHYTEMVLQREEVRDARRMGLLRPSVLKAAQQLPEPHSWQGKYIGGYSFEFTRHVPENKTRTVTKFRDETKYRDVIKYYQNVTKYKDVPEYQDVQVRKFDEAKYNRDVVNAGNAVDRIKSDINALLHGIKSTNTKTKQDLPLQLTNKAADVAHESCASDPGKNDEFKELFRQLNDEWKYLEYEAQALLDCQMELAGGG